MVLYLDSETEQRFREFLTRRGYSHGDLTRTASIALKEYMERNGGLNE